MSTLAEQVVEQLKTDMDNVYDAGYQKGKSEGGGGECLDVSKFGIINEVTGTNIATCDYVNENPHNVEVKLSSDTVTDFSDKVVKVCGKNIFYKANENRATCDISLPAGTTITCSAEETWTGSIDLIYSDGTSYALGMNKYLNGRVYNSYTLTKDLAQIRYRLIVTEPQVEILPIITDYEPYTETTYTANADGTVDVPSISPTMNIICDTEGVNVSAKYYCSPTAEYDRFWDKFQEYGKRTIYLYGFAGSGWTDDTFKIKYDLKPENMDYGFSNSSIVDLKGVLDKTNRKIDFSSCKTMSSILNGAQTKTFPDIDVTNLSNLNSLLFSATYLESIKIYGVKVTQKTVNTFTNCRGLKNVQLEGLIGSSINLQWSSLLTVESVQNIIDCLADLTGQTTQTITFHADVKAKLTEEQIASITAKNWTLA